MTPPPSGSPAPVGPAAEKTAVVKLKPVTLQITLYYMGSKRVKHDATNYRCKFRLLKEGASPPALAPAARADPGTAEVAPLAVISNVLLGDKPFALASKPGLPAADGGNSANPAADEIYRIEVVDNHGLPSSKENPGDAESFMDRGLRGKISKSELYTKKSWIPDVRPAAPFRVVVRKFVGDDLVALDAEDEIDVVLEVKDPAEEFAQTEGNHRAFLSKFFAKYNRTDKNPSPGDDNALAKFGGVREGSAGYPGMLAVDNLRKIDGDPAPKVIEAAPAADSVAFTDLKAPDALGKARATVACKRVQDPSAGNKEVGVADFVHMGPATSGDNFRYLVSLKVKLKDAKPATKSDPRDLKLNGVPVILVDDQKRPIKGKMTYTTGRFVMWRRLQFRLMVVFNGLPANSLNFSDVRDIYRRSFVEVEPPVHTHIADWKFWRDGLRNRYDSASADVWLNDANEVNIKLGYAEGIVPGVALPGNKFKFRHGGVTQHSYNQYTDFKALAQFYITKAAALAAVNIDDPLTGPGLAQSGFVKPDSDGMCIIYAKKKNFPGGSSLAGAYMGDRCFYMFETYTSDGVTPNAADITDTCAHELGHALVLPHALTGADMLTWTPTGANIGVMESTSNCFLADHDQTDAATCLMSYISSSYLLNYPYYPCAVCSLGLRGYDKSEIKKNDNTRFGKQIHAPLSKAVVCNLDIVNSAVATSFAGIRKGNLVQIVALGAEKTWPSSTGGFSGRVALSGLEPFTLSNAKLTFVKTDTLGRIVYHQFRCDGVGVCRVSFAHAGVTAHADINILPAP